MAPVVMWTVLRQTLCYTVKAMSNTGSAPAQERVYLSFCDDEQIDDAQTD